MATEQLVSNFDFLEAHDPLLPQLGALAERYFTDDPNTCLIKLRQFGEVLSQTLASYVGLFSDSHEQQFVLLDRLKEKQVLSEQINQLFHGIRKAGNDAVHQHQAAHGEALHQLKMAHKLSIWFQRSFGTGTFHPELFIPPTPPQEQNVDLAQELEALRQALEESQSKARLALITAKEEAKKRLTAEERTKQESEEREIWEQLAEELEKQLSERLAERQDQSQKQPKTTLQGIAVRAFANGEQLDLTEAETRHIIDQQLVQAGWETDSQELTYQKGTRPQKGRNLAISEWPVTKGRADYVLFIGLDVVGIVEAKRKNKDVAGSIEQAKRYSRDYIEYGEQRLLGPWEKYKIPFLFATNGRPFLEQLKTKSGIWFLDARHATNLSRPLVGWRSPEGLQKLLQQDQLIAQQELKEEPVDYLGLRDYQIKAIRATEQALEQGKRSCLLAMATGTGKTRTCVGLAYRLLKTKRFHRILFLVDRSALGGQAANAFKDARLENMQTFGSIFDIKELKDAKPDTDTKLHFATVQGLVKRILYPSQETEIPSVDQYDCIVVDESHRGYNLDRELSDIELTFRDQKSYISKYRRVLEYFDAVKIGLTATPALHTTEIFGMPIYQYSYEEAVVDGYLNDQQPPVKLGTKLAKDGMTWKADEDVEILDPKSGEIEKVKLKDELHLDIKSYNKRVITESFNKVICEKLTDYIDPSLEEKTLIFCATDQHADQVVNLLKEAFVGAYGPIEDDAVIKITGASDKPLKLLSRFRNERLPNVAVTVDLLTTGIDVPKICNIVFIRRVRSRILYEQMLGRATRLCPEIGKNSFRIFDAVDLYADFQGFTSMKPVVTNPKISFTELSKEISSLKDPEALAEVQKQFVAKLQQKKRTFRDKEPEEFAILSGQPLDAFIKQVKQMEPTALASFLTEKTGLCDFLDQTVKNPKKLIISEHPDELLTVEIGFGEYDKPEDYLQGFQKYLQDNINALPALLTVTQRPRELTRQQLKELRLKLSLDGFNESTLRAAWQQMTNQDIAASIIGFIRQQALKEDLIPYEDRVNAALKKLLGRQQWNPPQRKWLERIGKQLLKNIVVDKTAFDSGAFQVEGGYPRLNKIFKGHLEEILAELNESLWEQTG